MIRLIKQLFTLFTPSQHKRFYVLQIWVMLMAFMEIVSVASIIPFMALVGDVSQLQQDTIIAQVYQASSITSESEFVFLLGVGVLLMLVISAMVSMFTIWRLSIFANKVGIEIADRLYNNYIKQDWLFHASGSSAQLIKKIATETLRVTNAVLMPLMQINAKIALAFFMSLGILIYDPKVAIIGLSVLSIAYFILFKMVRKRLQNNGEVISEMNEKRFRLMNEGFGGIKDVLLLGRDNDFIRRFSQAGSAFAFSQGTNQALAYVPRYFIELIAFASMIMLVLYLISSHNGDLGMVLPIISVYAVAIFKLLPAFQQIYVGTATIKGNIAAFESIKQDLIDSSEFQQVTPESEKNYLRLKQQISLENVTFSYPGKEDSILNNLNMGTSKN